MAWAHFGSKNGEGEDLNPDNDMSAKSTDDGDADREHETSKSSTRKIQINPWEISRLLMQTLQHEIDRRQVAASPVASQ